MLVGKGLGLGTQIQVEPGEAVSFKLPLPVYSLRVISNDLYFMHCAEMNFSCLQHQYDNRNRKRREGVGE